MTVTISGMDHRMISFRVCVDQITVQPGCFGVVPALDVRKTSHFSLYCHVNNYNGIHNGSLAGDS